METRPGKKQLISEIDSSWAKLNETLGKLTPEQMAEIRDPQGWAVKDHLTHLAAWERSVVAFMHGKPRYEGLGVDKQMWDRGQYEEMNAVIQQRRGNATADEALAELRDTHAQLMELISPLTDEDLLMAKSDFRPDATDGRDERPVIGMIYSNTTGHFNEHEEYIASLAGSR